MIKTFEKHIKNCNFRTNKPTMKKLRSLIFTFILLSTFKPLTAQVQIGSTSVDTTTVISGIDIPWEIIWGPDEFIWMTERYGRISRINPQTGAQQVLLTLSDCYVQGETGLLGMALHPDFENTPQVFFVYTYLDGSNIKEKIVRYTYNGTILISGITLLSDIPGNTTHVGSRIVFLDDQTLLMTTGDAQNMPASQDLNSLAGKVLRMNTDGSIPGDNPWPGSYVYTYGFRNTQGLVKAPNGKIYGSEHGPTTDDELFLIRPGENHGWPDVHGFCDTPQEIAFCNSNTVTEPLYAWTPTIAPSGIAWYGSNSIPEWENSLLLAVLKDKMLISIKLNSAGDAFVSETKHLINMFGRIRDVCVSPEGDVYIATNGSSWVNTNPFSHRIVKIANVQKSLSAPQGKKKELKLYPNPAGEKVKIESEGIFIRIEIFDVLGKKIRSLPLPEQNEFVDVSTLPKGLYFILVESSYGTYTQKLLKD
jgi:aldose sugar dehydrogenase